MFEGLVTVSEFIDAYGSRDIVKLVRWLERRHRELIAPLVKGNKILKTLEEPAGLAVGKKIGQYFVDKYGACSLQEREIWRSSRWLHHGALGELLFERGKKKHKPFIASLGKGLMMTDLQDRDEWHTSEYWEAKKKLDKMQ
jgi:hypothetical protein